MSATASAPDGTSDGASDDLPTSFDHPGEDLPEDHPDWAPDWAYHLFRRKLMRRGYDLAELQGVLATMQERGWQPRSHMFLMLITQASHLLRPSVHRAFMVYHEMIRKRPATPEEAEEADGDGMVPVYPQVEVTAEVMTALIQCCGRAQPAEVDQAHEVWESLAARDDAGNRLLPQVAVDDRLVSRYFDAVARRKRGTTADDVTRCMQVFKDLSHLTPDGGPSLYTTTVFNELLHVIMRQRDGTDAKAALHLFNQLVMSKNTYPDVRPDHFTFSRLMTTISRHRSGASINDAIKLFRRIVGVNAKGERVFPEVNLNTFAFNGLFAVCVRDNDKEAALEVAIDAFKEMRRCHSKTGEPVYPNAAPDLVTYNTLLDLCAKIRPYAKQQAALRLFRRMRKDGIKPDVVTFNTMLFACVNAAGGADSRLAADTFAELLRVSKRTGERVYDGVEPDAFTFTLLMSCYMNRAASQGGPAPDMVLRVFDEMVSTKADGTRVFAAQPDAAAYKLALQACSCVKPAQPKRAMELLHEFRTAHHSGVNARAFHYAMAACEAAEPPAIADGLSVLRGMLRTAFKQATNNAYSCQPNKYTLAAAMRLCALQSPPQPHIAEGWFRRIVQLGVPPTRECHGSLTMIVGEDGRDELLAWAKEVQEARAKGKDPAPPGDVAGA